MEPSKRLNRLLGWTMVRKKSLGSLHGQYKQRAAPKTFKGGGEKKKS